jgi:hypothetical protein
MPGGAGLSFVYLITIYTYTQTHTHAFDSSHKQVIASNHPNRCIHKASIQD